MYIYEISLSLKEVLVKLSKKNKPLFEQVIKKIDEVVNSYDVEHYKNLSYSLKDRKRVHIGHYVLVFRLIKSDNKIIFLDFDHHDNIYKR
jgi:mRNA-degrading endonuclease RelE of RelBE toxin-antitoxin system